jgi:GNAT superfamily N-acetyltransferase
VFRDAVEADVPTIVAMYAADPLGETREDATEPLLESYWSAFAEIDADPRHRLIVAELDGEVVGTLQLSFVPHLVLRGGERAQIEAVRIHAGHRGSGLGEAMLRWAINEASDRGCRLLQLTTNVERDDAKRFYERLGFTASHAGMKLALTDP